MQGKKENIVHQMCSVLSERTCANRLILKSILETVILCGKQNINIPLRGHRNDASYLDADLYVVISYHYYSFVQILVIMF